MPFSINITGFVAEAEAEVHDAIHALTKDFMDDLHRLEGVKVDSAAVTTPTKSANVAHEEAAATAPAASGDAAADAGGTASVSGTDLKTGGEHALSAGSPPPKVTK